MSEEMKKKQYKLQNQFKDIERRNQRNQKVQSSYGKSIDYIAKSLLLWSKINQIATNNKRTKKKFFSKGFKQAADSLKESPYMQRLFKEEDKPIPSVCSN